MWGRRRKKLGCDTAGERSGGKNKPESHGHLLVNDRLESPGNILKKVFRKDGPPLGVAFDSLPPLAFCKASKNPYFRSPWRTFTSTTPDVREVRQESQDQVTHQSQPLAGRPNEDTSFVGDAPCTAGRVRSRKLQKSACPERIDLQMSAVAVRQIKRKRSRSEQATDTNLVKGRKKLKLKLIKHVLLNACSTAGEGGNGEGTLLELTPSRRIEPEAPLVAGSQDQGRQDASHPGQPIQVQEKAPELCNQLMDAPSTPEGTIRRQESQELVSSIRNEPEAPVLADFEEATQDQASDQPQPSSRKAKAEMQKDQASTIEEDASRTPEGGEIREKKVPTLISSEKNELEESAACNTVAQIAEMASSFHDQADSSSLTSSTLDWASAFDDVSSTGARYWGNNERMVQVGDYFVDQRHSATMTAIVKKYGDLAKDCLNSSTMFRSYAVQGVCEVVEGLQITLPQLSQDRLKTYLCFVREAALMGLTVKWLEERLDEISMTVESTKEYKNMRDERKVIVEKMEDLKNTRNGWMEIEKRKCESEVKELKRLNEAAKLDVKKKRSAIDDVKTRFKAVPKRLLDGLL